MLTRARKEEHVEELRQKFRRATCVYLADYRGLSVEAVNRLRRRIRSEGRGDFEYRVAKNTIVRRASEGSAVAPLSAHLRGPTAMALSYADPIGLARILADFARENEALSLKGGVLEGRAVSREEIALLATLPSLDALRGKLLGLLQAPATKLVRLLAEPGAQLARAVAARGRQAEGS